MNRNLLLIFFGGVIGILLAIGGAYRLSFNYTYHGSLYDPAVKAKDFELVDTNGQPFRLDQNNDRIRVLFFGYTHCPDVCPITLIEFRHIDQTLGNLADQVQFVFITVDPERDTQQVLKQHLSNYDPSIIGLSGTLDQLKAVWQDYGIYVKKQPSTDPQNYSMDHTARIFVIDKKGNLLLTYPYDMEEDSVVSDLRHLLKSN
jgi:protein SCO1/2